MDRLLNTYQDYSRKEVHDIFVPEIPFRSQGGSWGLHGIVAIPNRPDDFVFFVTFGQEQAGFIFEERITEDGILSWQSQTRQKLDSPMIKTLIKHDEFKNSIYLFLRTKKRGKYTYLGKLKYSSHDLERENPVFFEWQILGWQISNAELRRIGLVLQPMGKLPEEIIDADKYPEGAVDKISVNRYERSRRARKSCLNHYGTKCATCNFDFEDVYGKMGADYIHVHHIKPLSEVKEGYEVDPVQDLRPICPNCHAMLHYKAPALTIEFLKQILKNR